MDRPETINDFSKQGQDLADKTASKIQGGIQDAKRTAVRAGDQLSSKAGELRSDAGPMIKKATQQTQSIVHTVGDATQRVREAAGQASETVIAYAKRNPVTAILIAAASGAVLATLFHTISRSRD